MRMRFFGLLLAGVVVFVLLAGRAERFSTNSELNSQARRLTKLNMLDQRFDILLREAAIPSIQASLDDPKKVVVNYSHDSKNINIYVIKHEALVAQQRSSRLARAAIDNAVAIHPDTILIDGNYLHYVLVRGWNQNMQVWSLMRLERDYEEAPSVAELGSPEEVDGWTRERISQVASLTRLTTEFLDAWNGQAFLHDGRLAELNGSRVIWSLDDALSSDGNAYVRAPLIDVVTPLLLHEIGHLEDVRASGLLASRADQQEVELQADAFAIKKLKRIESESNTSLAVRWLQRSFAETLADLQIQKAFDGFRGAHAVDLLRVPHYRPCGSDFGDTLDVTALVEGEGHGFPPMTRFITSINPREFPVLSPREFATLHRTASNREAKGHSTLIERSNLFADAASRLDRTDQLAWDKIQTKFLTGLITGNRKEFSAAYQSFARTKLPPTIWPIRHTLDSLSVALALADVEASPNCDGVEFKCYTARHRPSEAVVELLFNPKGLIYLRLWLMSGPEDNATIPYTIKQLASTFVRDSAGQWAFESSGETFLGLREACGVASESASSGHVTMLVESGFHPSLMTITISPWTEDDLDHAAADSGFN